ncbi:adenosylmethionine--8-amino-7-oxononanoate aminotransferase BioA, partial [Methylobacterium trifolii]
GAIGAVQFASPPDLAVLKARLVERGVWVRPFGDVLYLTPALTIGPADLDLLVASVVAEALRSA